MPGPEWIWVIIVIAVIFGASRLPAMGRNFGLGIKEFKKGIAEAGQDDGEGKDQPDQARRQAHDERGPSA
jgi:sec-independent protein translocase protein TatA